MRSLLHPLAKLKRIDLSSNFISSIDDDALRLLPDLKDLILPENQLAALPVLPTGIEVLDVRLNRLRSSGIQPEAFKVSQGLQSTAATCHLRPRPHTHTSLALLGYPCSNPGLGYENQTLFLRLFLRGSFCCNKLILTEEKVFDRVPSQAPPRKGTRPHGPLTGGGGGAGAVSDQATALRLALGHTVSWLLSVRLLVHLSAHQHLLP